MTADRGDSSAPALDECRGCEGPWCHQQIAVASKGRPRRYCSDACRQAAYRRRAGPGYSSAWSTREERYRYG